MTEKLKQINVAFAPVEDRLLMRVSTEGRGQVVEYRFWLTRRFLRLFWQHLEQVLDAEALSHPLVPAEGREAFKQFKQEAGIEGADFSTPYSAETAQTPLGPAPLLLTGFKITVLEKDTHAVTLQAVDGRSINININLNLLHSLRKLMAEQARVAEWNINMQIFNHNVPRTLQ
jgi:hypothetical protein